MLKSIHNFQKKQRVGLITMGLLVVLALQNNVLGAYSLLPVQQDTDFADASYVAQ